MNRWGVRAGFLSTAERIWGVEECLRNPLKPQWFITACYQTLLIQILKINLVILRCQYQEKITTPATRPRFKLLG